jgi:hypothetical protein
MQPFASARTYAMRRFSPNRPFKHVIIGGLYTALFLVPDPNNRGTDLAAVRN